MPTPTNVQFRSGDFLTASRDVSGYSPKDSLGRTWNRQDKIGHSEQEGMLLRADIFSGSSVAVNASAGSVSTLPLVQAWMQP